MSWPPQPQPQPPARPTQVPTYAPPPGWVPIMQQPTMPPTPPVAYSVPIGRDGYPLMYAPVLGRDDYPLMYAPVPMAGAWPPQPTPYMAPQAPEDVTAPAGPHYAPPSSTPSQVWSDAGC